MNTFFISQPHAIEMAIEIITLVLLWYVARTTNEKIGFLNDRLPKKTRVETVEKEALLMWESYFNFLETNRKNSLKEKPFASKKRAEGKRLKAVGFSRSAVGRIPVLEKKPKKSK